jgi:uncharacterized protein YqjF (DUF2071 family)
MIVMRGRETAVLLSITQLGVCLSLEIACSDVEHATIKPMSIHPDLESHVAFTSISHRPWPLPNGRWVWRQSWRDLLFAHWPIAVADVRALLPAGLDLDTFDGVAWLGVVPFRMAGVAPRYAPTVPGISEFPELNVRLYVTRDNKPGVWFLSLDATSRIAVTVGRRFYHAPYHLARMAMTADEGQGVVFRSERRGSDAAVFGAHYQPASAPAYASAGTLEHFLTERYCFYASAPDGTLFRNEVHHHPWSLQAAVADIEQNGVTAAAGLPVSGPPALLHFARRVDVVIWPAQTANRDL